MTFQERYQYNPKTDLLGKGGFARVYKAKDALLDRDVAIKVFNINGQTHYTIIEEIKRAIRLEHPNLLRYYDAAVLKHTTPLGEEETIQIGVMELANAGDLKQFAQHNPGSPLLFKLLQQVLSGLEYLHANGIIHRDLKPQNILLVERNGELSAKISDFGISKSLDSGTASSSMAIGTIEYMAPEQFNPAKYGINGKIGTNVDLWSFGIMVHELLTNEPIFGQRNGNTTAEQIMASILSTEVPADLEKLPAPYREAVKECLVKDAKTRVQKANELIAILQGGPAPAPSQANETIVLPKFNKAAGSAAVNGSVTATMPVNHASQAKARKPEKKWSFWKTFLVLTLCVILGSLLERLTIRGRILGIAIIAFPVFIASIVIFIIQCAKFKSHILKKKWGCISLAAIFTYIFLAAISLVDIKIEEFDYIRNDQRQAFSKIHEAEVSGRLILLNDALNLTDVGIKGLLASNFLKGFYNQDSLNSYLFPFANNMHAVDSLRNQLAKKTSHFTVAKESNSVPGEQFLDFFSESGTSITARNFTDDLLFLVEAPSPNPTPYKGPKLDRVTNIPSADALGHKYGAADKNGNLVIPLRYDAIEVVRFSNNQVILFGGELGKGWSLLVFDQSRQGTVLADSLSFVSVINDSLGLPLPYFITSKAGSGVRFIDASGKVLSGPYYEVRFGFGSDQERNALHNLIEVSKDGKAGYIDVSLDPVIPLTYDGALGNTPYTNLLCVKKQEKWGFINRKGEEMIPFKFDSIKYWGNKTKEKVTPLQLDSANFAGVYANGRFFTIDINGHEQ